MFRLFSVSAGQTVSVVVTTEPSDNGTAASVICSYSLTGAGYTFYNLEWSKGNHSLSAVLIADFFGGATTPTYCHGYGEPAYTVTKNDAMSSLTIAESIFDIDTGTYWCHVEYRQGGSNRTRGTSYANLAIYGRYTHCTLCNA